jgi:dynein heavy chain
VLIHWTRQIKEVISQADSTSSAASQDSLGPLSEIAYYVSRCNDLSGVTEQLSAPRLLSILSVLDAAGSAYLGTFREVSTSIKASFDEASDNLRLLTILKSSCETLAAAAPADIANILPDILAKVRIISMVSRFYCDEERVTALLRCVSNEVIRRCAVSINVRDVFEGDPAAAIRVLNEAILCLNAWRRVYDSTVEAVLASPVGKTPRGQIWARLDDSSIFALTEAVRCDARAFASEGVKQLAQR